MMPTTPRRTEIESMYYLSHLQEGLLFHHVAEEEVDPYVDQAVYHLEGTIDVPAFEQAWQSVVQHHAVLRTAFVWEQVPRPIQVVHKAIRLSIEYADWQSSGEATQAAELRATMEADRRQGFEFRRAPLLRLRLIRTGPRDYALLYTHHHILLDGWSFQLMVRDVLDCYGALIQGEKPKLDPVRPYRDYIAWLQRQDLQEAEQFWRTYLAGFTAPTRLPSAASPSTSEPSMLPFAEQSVVLSSADSERVRAFIRQQRLTLNTMMQGAWAVLLQRYDQEADVVFGTTVSGRPPDLEGADTMVGLFINTLPVLVRINDDAQVSSWLKTLQEQNSALRHYEYTPLAKIQGWSDVPSGRSLFETIVVFENFPIREQAGLAIHDLQIRTRPMGDAGDGYRLTKGRNNYPISLVVEPGANIQITLCYAHERFSHAMMGRWLAQFRKIMDWMMTHSHGRLSDLTLVTPEERTRMLMDWNPTPSMPVETRCVHELVEAIAGREPDRSAMVFEEQRLTYGELNRRANRLAHRLRAAGVGPGMRVGLCLERSPELPIAIWGVLKAGAAYVPVEPSMPPERLVFLLKDAGVAVLLTQTAVRLTFSAETVAELQSIRMWDVEDVVHRDSEGGSDANLAPPHPESAAYVIYTSGSTGQPKGVAVSHRALASYVSSVLVAMAVPETATRWALLSTVAADLGHTMLFGALCAGRTLHLLSTDHGFHPEQMAAYMQREQIHVLKITPSHLAGLLDATHPEQVLPSQCLVLGGEALTWPLVERIHALAPACTVINHYGPTETTVGVLTHRVDVQKPRRGATVPLGRPLAHSRAYILDRHLEPAPVGLTGELYLGGAGLAHGYYQQPGLTADRFLPDPFNSQPGARMYRTGDQARYREDGTIEFLGRRDHQVKLRGYRIELGEIEAQLLAYPEVQEAVVVLREGAAGAKQLVAYVVPTSGSGVPVSDLRTRLARQLPDYMVPQVIIELATLPLTPNGKLDRAALPHPEQSRDQKAKTDAGPQTDVEQRLAEIWGEVLRRDQIGRQDNFFELGGDSILSLQIIARAHRRGLKLTPKQLFERPTIAGLAEVVMIRAQEEAAFPEGPVTGTVPLTPIQHWFFEAQHPNPHHWNQAVLLKVEKPLELPLLVQAMQILVGHHDTLRLRFHSDPSGQWTQAYAPMETHPLCRQIDLTETLQGQNQSWTEVLDALATEVQPSLNITEGPLLQAVYFDRGAEEPGRLLLVVHHLVVDGVSWRVLVEDLQMVYRQLAQKRPVVPPRKTTSWKTWSERLRMYADSDAFPEERTYWLAEGCNRTALLSDASARAGRVGDAATERVRLSTGETRALLHEVPSVYRTEINDILLTALAQTLCRWSGRPSVDVELEGHGREDLFDGVDVSRTVGWFTTRFPVTLTPGKGGPGEAIQAIKAQLRRIPRKGIGYGVLRYLSQDAALRQALMNELPPAVCFNYLGQLDVALEGETLFTLAHESVGPSRDLQSKRREVLDVNVQIVEHQLSVDWTYPSSDRDAVAMRRLADRYVEALRELITHCLSPGAGGMMASDFEAAGLTDEELHDLLKEMG